jgi:uncharacterized SAM-binding protein YcdF (DUF218 family)
VIGSASFLKAVFGLLLLGFLALAAGFFAFCASLPRADDDLLAELGRGGSEGRGIIVLTGDNGPRIERGLELQAQGVAERALISGVHPQTRKEDLASMGRAEVLACCVDLGPWARSTKGNAIESRDWLARHGFDTAILVTSDFHLPRARAELRRSVPDLTIIGVPVASNLAPQKEWMGSARAWRVLTLEYLKFLFVSARSLV